MIAVEKIDKMIGGVRALDGVSFAVAAHSVVGLIGPNGSGKSTVIDILSGATQPTAGTVNVAGERVDGLPSYKCAAKGIARTFQAPRLFARLTALENVVAGAYLQARDGFWQVLVVSPAARREAAAVREAAREALATLGLTDVADVDVRHLSEGERRRVEIARALVAKPNVLLLDEPLSGLDDGESAIVRNAIREFASARDVAVIVAERDLRPCLGWCDRVVVLHAGRKVAEGPPDVARRDPEVLDAYLGVEWRQ